VTHDLGVSTWADWDPSGALVLTREGAIARIELAERHLSSETVVADFSADIFERVPPPDWAVKWPR